MRALILAICVALFPLTANAICVSQSTQDDVEACVNLGAGLSCVPYSNLSQGSGAQRAAQLEAALQAIIDDRQLRVSMPLDDPDRALRPNGFPRSFWSDGDGIRHDNVILDTFRTFRCAVVTVTWDQALRDFIISYRDSRF